MQVRWSGKRMKRSAASSAAEAPEDYRTSALQAMRAKTEGRQPQSTMAGVNSILRGEHLPVSYLSAGMPCMAAMLECHDRSL